MRILVRWTLALLSAGANMHARARRKLSEDFSEDFRWNSPAFGNIL
jgi:hypothetical protein